jgi:hypothetical protein
MDASPQRLSRAQDTAIFPENSDCPVESRVLLTHLLLEFLIKKPSFFNLCW